jgi:hypothetical protein
MRISLEIPKSMLEALKDLAARRGLDLEACIVSLIEQELDRQVDPGSSPVLPPSLPMRGPLGLTARELSNAALFQRLHR